MYGYIYDTFLGNPNYQKELIKIENSLTDLELRGQTIKLSLMNSVGHSIRDLLQRGVKTIIAVGSDQLFSRIIDDADILEGVTLGIIPLGSHQRLAYLFGVPSGEQACQVIAARLIQKVSLGKINNAYFIDSVMIDDPRVQIGCDNLFLASATTKHSRTSIHNLVPEKVAENEKSCLAVRIQPELPKKIFRKQEELPPTILKSQFVNIEYPQNIHMIVDGQKVIKTPAKLQVAQKTINVIMGKERKI